MELEVEALKEQMDVKNIVEKASMKVSVKSMRESVYRYLQICFR